MRRQRERPISPLKMVGDSPDDAPYGGAPAKPSWRAGGAGRTNVFTRLMLALFGFIPLARGTGDAGRDHAAAAAGFPFHIDKMSYWSRTVIVPLLVLMAKKPKARNRKGVRIDELFPGAARRASPRRPRAPQQKNGFWFVLFSRHRHDAALARAALFRKACASAPSIARVAFVKERLNGEDGLGAIFPAMANSVMMFRRARPAGL